MKDHFDLLAPLYEKFIHPREPVDLAALAGLPTDGALLDAGGGTGRLSQFLTRHAKQVIIADLSMDMLRQAKQKPALNAVRSHSEHLPFGDDSFSAIIMVDALHHVCDQRQTVEDLLRVLAPGGTLVIEEPDLRKFSVKLIAIAEKLALMRSHFLSPERIAELFTGSQARVQVETGEFNAWIIVKKDGPENLGPAL